MKTGKISVMLMLLLTLAVVYEISYPSVDPIGKILEAAAEAEDDYIKWIDFTPTQDALSYALRLDVSTYGTDKHLRMHELLAVYSAINGGSYERFKKSSLDVIYEKYKKGASLSEIASNERLLNYYLESYEAVIGGFVGEYFTADASGRVSGERKYGLRVFSPIAKNYGYTHYDDFGASRSYGYKRSHLGHDIMSSIGTPIIAVESGYVEACGWNQYGGWRIGIRSFDGKRYYYYAHLRKGHPYNDIYEGKAVNAGEVIGYLGMTGYSAKEDTNNINTPHLHYGLQIIFDKKQKDGVNQIWIDMYEITKFLYVQRAAVIRSGNEYNSLSSLIYDESPD